MSDETDFRWPEGDAECAELARSMFIRECVGQVRYWVGLGSDKLSHPEPERPFIRAWSEIAKRDRAYRENFNTLNESQRAKVLELLEECVQGAVFSTVCILDQFPHGEAELSVWDGVCGEGKRRFRIAPGKKELHDEFSAAVQAQRRSERPGGSVSTHTGHDPVRREPWKR
jgi:hypothetical protein